MYIYIYENIYLHIYISTYIHIHILEVMGVDQAQQPYFEQLADADRACTGVPRS